MVPRVSAPGTGLGATERCYDIKGPMGRAKSKCWRELVCVFCEILFGGNAGLAGGRLWHQAVAYLLGVGTSHAEEERALWSSTLDKQGSQLLP